MERWVSGRWLMALTYCPAVAGWMQGRQECGALGGGWRCCQGLWTADRGGKIKELMNITLEVPFLINTVKGSGRVQKHYRQLYTIHKQTEPQCFLMSKYFVVAPLRRWGPKRKPCAEVSSASTRWVQRRVTHHNHIQCIQGGMITRYKHHFSNAWYMLH